MIDYCRYVDVFLGCDDIDLPKPEGIAGNWHFIKALCGNTHPGAVLPFGKLSCCAYSGAYSAGYGRNKVNCGGPIAKLYEQNKFKGLSHIHMSGTGYIGVFYNYAVTTPFYGELRDIQILRNIISEDARPGYYSCKTADDIFSEATVTENTVLHRYTFAYDSPRIAIEFSNDGMSRETDAYSYSEKSEISIISDTEVCATVIMQGIQLYMYAKCSGAIKTSLWVDYLETDNNNIILEKTKNTFGCVFDLIDRNAEIVFSVSALSMEKARTSVLDESLGFDRVCQAAYDKWNETLSKIHIETDSDTEKEVFYSNLYHTYIKPCDWSGEGLFGTGDGDCLIDFATLWDMYKTQLPLVFSLFPDIRRKTLNSFISAEKYCGRLPHTLLLASDVDIAVMQARTLAQFVIADAYFRGRNADNKTVDGVLVSDLLQACKNDIYRQEHDDFTIGGDCEKATHLLDICEACRSVALIAQDVGMSDLAFDLNRLYQNWSKAFTDGMLRADSEYYEGNFWSYSFRLMHDMDARIKLLGSSEKFAEKLDHFFGFTDSEDIANRFQGFNNETDMETPYAYHYCNRRDRLCEILSSSFKYMFVRGRGGIPGNNDSGGLSSCYIWNALGVFPVSGQDKMLIGSPFFKESKLTLANGNELVIKKVGDSIYTRSAKLNGKELSDMTFQVTDMMKGGELVINS